MRLYNSLPLLLPICIGLSLAQQVHARIYATPFQNVTWDDYNWRLTTTYADPGHFQARASLANGYIGINVASLGPFYEWDSPLDNDNIQGWPLFTRRQAFATVAGFWNAQPGTNETNFEWLNALGWESLISGIPHWAGIYVRSGEAVLNATTNLNEITAFSSTFDYGTAVMSWRYTWTPPFSPALDIEYSLLVHKLFINQAATQLKITSSTSTNLIISDVLDGDCAVRSQFADKGTESNSTIYTAVKPDGISNVTAYVYSTLTSTNGTLLGPRLSALAASDAFSSNTSSISQSFSVELQAGNTIRVQKFVGVASSDAFSDPQNVARNASVTGSCMGYVGLLQSHIDEWKSVLTRDSVDQYNFPESGSLPDDPNILHKQILAVVNLFYMLQNTVSTHATQTAHQNDQLDLYSISVCGLTSDCYAGQIYWDVEVWMQPGLVLSHPAAASQIWKYRNKLYPQAKQNINSKLDSSQANTTFANDASVYPWTSGRFGNCTGIGPCFDYEYHINGDIALELRNFLIATGDADIFESDMLPMYDSVAQFYSNLLQHNTTTGLYSLLNATDPDEYANHVDNPGYTMALIRNILTTANEFHGRYSLPNNTFWTSQSSSLTIPSATSADILLEYSGMNGTISVKQADVILISDFLDMPSSYTLPDLDYYAGKQSANGPGMTYGVFSVVASETSPSGCSSYTYDLYGSIPYLRAPWYQYSEQLLDNFEANGGTHPAFPFLTGAGGAHRVAPYGYLGLRLQPDALHVNPTLPPQIPHINYRTIFWRGHAINATANATHTILSRLPSTHSLVHADMAYLSGPIPVTVGATNMPYALSLDGAPLVIPNRAQANINTVPGNLAQCQHATSDNQIVPGQFALSAVDGAASTKWQPLNATLPASMTVALGAAGRQLVAGFAFDWAQAPPVGFTVRFSNDSSGTADASVVALNEQAVRVSSPFEASAAAAIVPYASNTTNVTLPAPVWGGSYATLTVWGNQADDSGRGATVAEWAILSVPGG